MLAGHFTAKLPDKQLCVFISFLFVLDINKLHKMMFISIIYFSLVGQLVNGMQFQAFLLDGLLDQGQDQCCCTGEDPSKHGGLDHVSHQSEGRATFWK